MAHNPLEKMKVTTAYGVKNHGNIVWAAGHHTGVDLAADYDDPIGAVLAGQIIHIGRFGGWGPAYGIHVLVKTGDIVVGYCHLSSVNLKNVQDHIVKEGEILGYAGASGNAHGVHLHLEARKAPYRYGVDAFDPMDLFKHPSGKPVKKAPAKKVSPPK
jgi:hypothetical protein